MILLELFDQKYHWEVTASSHDWASYPAWSAIFVTENQQKIEVLITNSDDDEVELVFFDITGGTDEVAQTGKGDAYRVFATVLDVLDRYAAQISPGRISFSSVDGDSRTRLYTQMMKRRCPQGYELGVYPNSYGAEFVLSRITDK
jgi:hypothetical protein